jgi:hypothetical protein
MLRIALAIALGFSVISLTSYSVSADDKKEDKKPATKTLEGKLVCTKCTLNETKACGHALLVKEGDKTVTYYIADKGGKEKYHGKVCPGGTELDAKVTGKVVEKDKKKTITDAKVELK